MPEKKKFWRIKVGQKAWLDVEFEEELSATEAMEHFDDKKYYDVIDEDIIYSEAEEAY